MEDPDDVPASPKPDEVGWLAFLRTCLHDTVVFEVRVCPDARAACTSSPAPDGRSGSPSVKAFTVTAHKVGDAPLRIRAWSVVESGKPCVRAEATLCPSAAPASSTRG